MTTGISNFCILRNGVHISGYIVAAASGLSAAATIGLSYTVGKTAEAYAKYCPSAGSVVTGMGNMTCTELEVLYDANAGLYPTLAWITPIAVIISTVFVIHQITNGLCCPKRDYTPIHQLVE